MTTTKIMFPAQPTDAELVTGSLDGNREAFRQIVERYKTLVCSVAYSATGNVSQSEDLAQETFITAWENLRLLREPGKLRGWLCGIARHRTQKYWDRSGRQPIHHAESLAEAHAAPAPEAWPSDEAITREEEAILWRSLAKIPELYREPLILFYREYQSIERVAVALDLSEDAVKQRLSRGRKLLQEEVHAFVESALHRTAPKPAFSHAVLAALPMATGPATALGWGAAVKGAGATKAGLLMLWLAPVIGSFGGLAAQWIAISTTTSDRQVRARKMGRLIAAWFFLIGMAIGGEYAVKALGRHFEWSPRVCFFAAATFWWVYACGLITWVITMIRPYLALGESSPRAAAIPSSSLKAGLFIAMVAGVNLSLGSWLAYLAWTARDWPAIEIIFGTLFVLGIGHCAHVMRRTGMAAARVALGHTSLAAGAVLLIFNLRFDGWVALAHGVSVAEIHELRPMWIIPLLTVAFLAWGGLVNTWLNQRCPVQ